MKAFVSALLLTFSVAAFALRRPISLEIDGQQISEPGSLIFSWESNPVLKNFSEVKVNGKVLEPYLLHKGQAIFLRVDDGTGDYRMDYLRNGPERRLISCEQKTTLIPKKIKVSKAASLKFGEAVLAYPLQEELAVPGQTFNYYLCTPN